MALEHVRRLDDVVVDAHEDHLVHPHGCILGRRTVAGLVSADMSIPVGVLYDFPQGDAGRYFEEGLQLGFAAQRAEERLGDTISLIGHQADGLPAGSAESVVEGFEALVAQDVVAIVGPSISDNGLIVRDLADAAGVPCINYTGGAFTRGAFMFHYQVGSLEEEPVILAEHLLAQGHHRVAVLYDDTPVGTQYFEWLGRTVARIDDPELVHTASVSPLAEDLQEPVAAALATEPDALLYLGLGVAARAVSLAVDAVGWSGPVVTNSALMFGYARPDWRSGFEDWVYIDTISDANPLRDALRETSRMHAASPIGAASYDMGRLLGEGLVLADDRTPPAVRVGLERVKRLPATSGKAGTTMGFGDWDHAALSGEYLVLRAWRGGRTVEVE
jgi:ABC-type branched-subunit amino acid transport system substrate-binding protein